MDYASRFRSSPNKPAEQTDRLMRLVEDLLDLSRADAGRLALNRRPTNIAKLIHEALEQQQVQAVTHRISVDLDPNLPTERRSTTNKPGCSKSARQRGQVFSGRWADQHPRVYGVVMKTCTGSQRLNLGYLRSRPRLSLWSRATGGPRPLSLSP